MILYHLNGTKSSDFQGESMYDPRLEPIPTDPVAQIRAFVRDLAYGALVKDWSTEFIVARYGASRDEEWVTIGPGSFDSMEQKWQHVYPRVSFLLVFGYVVSISEDGYRLTNKAFELLEQPSAASIFISYRRSESSLFALLLVARLKAVGLDPFLDMQNIEPGEEWRERLEQEVRRRPYFVCLISPITLQSQYVRQEISWAEQAGVKIIPMWHNGYNDTLLSEDRKQYPELGDFLQINAIQVRREDVEEYNNAVLRLLNHFGYTP